MTESPDGNGQPIRVVAAVVVREGAMLICERSPDRRHAGLWEFPGGKVEAGEDVAAAVTRELAEELGLRVRSVGELLFSANDPGSHFRIDFVRVDAVGEPECLEHSALAWVAPEHLRQYRLAPGDSAFARFLETRAGTWTS